MGGCGDLIQKVELSPRVFVLVVVEWDPLIEFAVGGKDESIDLF